MQPYAAEFNRRYGMGERGPKWFARSALTNGERGEFAAPKQQDLWSQMRFRSTLVETKEQFDWWVEFIKRHSMTGHQSAELSDEASGPCELFMCYFEFNGIPCIVVPLYRHRGVGLAQGIVKLTRNFDTHGFLGLYRNTPEAYNIEPVRRAVDGVEDMSIMLLAQVCKSMEIDLLFASPINFFRYMLLVYIERNDITHWLSERGSLTGKGAGIDTDLIDDDLPCPPWCPRRSGGVFYMKLHYDDGEVIDLGHLVRRSHMLIPAFDIVHQKWHANERHRAYVRNGDLAAYVDELYPYNFLWLIAGDGMLIMDAASMAEHAPLM